MNIEQKSKLIERFFEEELHWEAVATWSEPSKRSTKNHYVVNVDGCLYEFTFLSDYDYGWDRSSCSVKKVRAETVSKVVYVEVEQ